MPYVASLAPVLAALQLLDYLSPEYLMMSHRFWEINSFKVGFPLLQPLLILTLVTVIWILFQKPRAVLPTVIGGLLLVLDLGRALYRCIGYRYTLTERKKNVHQLRPVPCSLPRLRIDTYYLAENNSQLA
jgi:hypothetical protein